MKERFTCFLFLLSTVFPGGCVSTSNSQLKTLPESFYDGEYETVVSGSMRQAQSVPENAALCHLRAGSAALCSGNIEQAKHFFEKANEIIWAFEQRNEMNAIIRREDSKTFLGAPYERAFASYYLGITDLLTRDYENALAAFKTALLADAGGKTQAFDSDIPVVFFLMAHCYNALGENKQAQECMREVRTLYPERIMRNVLTDIVSNSVKILDRQNGNNSALLTAAESVFDDLFMLDYEQGESLEEYWGKIKKEASVPGDKADKKDVNLQRGEIINAVSLQLSRISTQDYESFIKEKEKSTSMLHYSSNLLVIIDIGRGPYKYMGEGHGNTCRIQKSSNTEKRAQVTVGSTDVQSTCLADVFFQASTRGGREMDFILGDKAFFKDTIDLGAVLGLNPLLALATHGILNVTINTEADIRTWLTLPGEIHVVSETLPEGTHQIAVRFCNLFGVEIPQMTQTRTVSVTSGQKTVIYIRSVTQ